jgi:uncharacterized membrane protein YesL
MTEFEQNQKMFDIFSGFKDLVFASLIWIIASIPIITIGIATSSFYHVIMKSIRKKEGRVFKEFSRFFLKNFKRVSLTTLIFVIITLCVIIGFYISVTKSEESRLWNVFSYAYRLMILFIIMLGIFVFPCFTHSQERGLKILSIGLSLCIKHLFTSFTCAILVIIAVCITYYMPVLLLITPGLTTLIISMVLETYLNEEVAIVYSLHGEKNECI